MHFFINGEFTTEEDAKLSVLDLGLLRGLGVFEYMRTYQNRPFHLVDHLKRLQYSAKKMGLILPYSFTKIDTILKELLQRSPHPEHSIKIVITGGLSPDQITPSEEVSFVAFCYPLTPYPSHFFTEGIKTITSTNQRFLPECKTTNYAPGILALAEAKQTGAQEALFLSSEKKILEATTSNFFAFRNGTLITPPEDQILLGITRALVLRLAHNHFPIEIRSIGQNSINFLEEAFITASNKEIIPISHIDGIPIGKRGVRPQVSKIQTLFRDYTEKSDWPELSIPRYE